MSIQRPAGRSTTVRTTRSVPPGPSTAWVVIPPLWKLQKENVSSRHPELGRQPGIHNGIQNDPLFVDAKKLSTNIHVGTIDGPGSGRNRQ